MLRKVRPKHYSMQVYLGCFVQLVDEPVLADLVLKTLKNKRWWYIKVVT